MSNELEMFWDKLGDCSNCWEWNGDNELKYGRPTIKRGKTWRSISAHRLAWELYIGDIPEGKCVLHQCDNMKCVNPQHLFLGTYEDNSADMVQKGRSLKGERHGLAKLTKEKVMEIRTSSLSQVQLGRIYNVTQANISSIKRHKTWK